MSVQYTIPFTVQPDFSAQALIPHAGIAAARPWLGAEAQWPTSTLILSGRAATGKSHLAALATLAACDLTVWDLTTQPLQGMPEAERLFHLINHVQAHHGRLLILSRAHPTEIYPALPDLDSRLKAASHVNLREPEAEAQRQAILFKMATDHQLRLDLTTAAYISARLPQTLAALRSFCTLASQQHLKVKLSKIAAKPLIEAVGQAQT